MKVSTYEPGVFPTEYSESDEKKCVGSVVTSVLKEQVLDAHRSSRNNVALILDTRRLLTLTSLLQWRRRFKKIIIVEHDHDEYLAIRRNLRRRYPMCLPMVEVHHADVFDYLKENKTHINFMWLDLMCAWLDEYEFSIINARLWAVDCLVITIAARYRGGLSVKKRVVNMKKRFRAELPHNVLDYGYCSYSNDGTRGQPMQVIAFGRVFAHCEYRPKNAVRITGEPNFSMVQWAGYPLKSDRTRKFGAPSLWKAKCSSK